MGREIRRVPKGWEHPRDEQGRFISLHDQTYEDAAQEWWDAALKWQLGDVAKSENKYRKEYPWYWDWSSPPPTKESYRPAFTAPADHFQIYETVSEGSPVSPVFESKEAMIAWMTQPIDRSSEYNVGEDWQCMQGMTRKQAESFCEDESAPSLVTGPGVGVAAGHKIPDEVNL